MPVPVRGIIAIGQFGYGFFYPVTIWYGVVSIGQFTIAGYTLAQFAFAHSLIAQMGIYIQLGRGQLVIRLKELLEML